MNEVIILGQDWQTGAYLLRLKVDEDLLVRFGRFQQGRPLLVHSGDYVYVGSAMAGNGSMILARRLLRHATRTDAHQPQKIRQKLLLAFKAAELGPQNLLPPEQKKLFWNIDYLLEEDAVSLSQVIILRSRTNLEDDLAHFVMDQPGSRCLANGLGAHDRPGQTHLLAITETAEWWQQLPAALKSFVGGFSKLTR
jgi:Uri superfamily endonuclease